MTMTVKTKNIGVATLADTGELFKLTIDHSGTPGKNVRHSMDGTTVTKRDNGQFIHIAIEEAPVPLRIDWITFKGGLPDGISTITAKLPDGWCSEYKWNHVVTYKDRTRPHASIATCISRNCWVRPAVRPDGFECKMAQLEAGPCHLTWIARQGAPFAVKSFKDVGAAGLGGVKFRIGSAEFILFHLEKTDTTMAGRTFGTEEGLAILRYENTLLKEYWHLTDTDAKVWK